MKKQTSGRISSAVILLLFLAGLSLLLYPAVSNYWNTARQTRAILSYDDSVSRLREEEARQLWAEAEDFNRSLLDRPSAYALTEDQAARYPSALLAEGSDVMAYLEIPSIGITLPICHGTENDTLQKSVGHLEWSSLPTGGPDTHCVLSGHRGLPSSELLTNIDHLETGDLFYIHVLGRRLTYQVDQISVVEPDDFSQLGIQPGEDYVTLLTCTPYGINTHRLLVRGVRVEEGGSAAPGRVDPPNELQAVPTGYLLAAALLACGLLILIYLLLCGRKTAPGRRETHE